MASYVPPLPIHGYSQGFRVPWGSVVFLGPGVATTKSGEYPPSEDSGKVLYYRNLDEGDRFLPSLDAHLQYGWSRVAIGSGMSFQQAWYGYVSFIPTDGHMLSAHWGYPFLALDEGSPVYGVEYLKKVRAFSLGGGLTRIVYPTSATQSAHTSPTAQRCRRKGCTTIARSTSPYLRAALLRKQSSWADYNYSLEVKYGYMPGWEHPHYLMFGSSMPM